MDFTYESTNTERLETYEWDNTWIDHAKSNDRMRVLYIGDSISCGTRKLITERSNGEIYCDGYGTSKALDNPFFRTSLVAFAKQMPKYDAIIFNNGLHGWHLDDEGDYVTLLDEMVAFIKSEFPSTPIFYALTTHVASAIDEARVKIRNSGAIKVASKHSLPIIDLYSLSCDNAELQSTDGVHFLTTGYEKLADLIIDAVKAKD